MITYLKLVSKHRNSLMGFAMLWIMLFHIPVLSGFKPLDFIQSIGYGGVDIFLFLSGFGLYFSMSKYNQNLNIYYKNRFIRIVPEFWFTLCVVYLLQMDFSINSFCHLLWDATTLGYWIGCTSSMWFISFILVLYAIYPFYFKLFNRFGMKVPILLICIGIVFLFCYAYISVHYYDNQIIGGLTIFSYARIPIFLIGSIFGYWAKNEFDFTLGKKVVIMCLIAAFISIMALGIFLKFASKYLCTCSLYFFPFIIITPVLCVILAVCFEKVKYIDKLFTFIGAMSLELFLCHSFPFIFFSFFAEDYGILMACLFVFLLSFLLAFILLYINKGCLQRFFK